MSFTVTFGDMLALADGHLAQVAGALARPDAGEQARRPATVAELSRLVGVLARYSGRIATGFDLLPAAGTGVQQAARQAVPLLTRAQDVLGTPAGSEPPGPELAWDLHATATALGCGLDLLATHLSPPPEPDVPLAGNAAVIVDADTARLLLRTVGEYAAVAGRAAFHSGPAGRQAGELLLRAAFIGQAFVHDEITPVTAIPLNQVPDRIPPGPGESREQKLAGIDISVRRLNPAEVRNSLPAWRYLTSAAAVSCDIGQHLIQQLARRAAELGLADAAGALDGLTPTVRQLGRRWKRIATRWHGLTREHTDPVVGTALDASDLVLRLGRLLYADPGWAPGPRASLRVTPLEHLAATPADLAQVGTAVFKAFEGCDIVARHHRAALNDLFTRDVLRAPPRASGRYKPNHDMRVFLRRYENLHADSREMIARFARALQSIPDQPSGAIAETTLVARRTAVPDTSSPVALAATGFPVPITEAVQGATAAGPSLPPTALAKGRSAGNSP
ncbi:hypothetical protein DPM19_09575 [Actinomadura craniellae]|uniref:Uncharacterized protein n=1 Tax=Actinomadura craniellae TaxID=2231787 RepID=A0A365H7A0_9ACTN|nr:hypothetical protein [Actinomadura craniellae]RAY14990.1 hypothetical protein DPM19_09575 [Actinomadura craniellae]